MKHEQVEVHETAIVAKSAVLGRGVKVGAYASVGANVVIGDRCTVEAYASIDGHTTIGSDCRIDRYAFIGCPPQHRDYKGEPCRLIVGDRNTFNPYTNISIGTPVGNNETRVGNDNLFMIGTHLGHDVILGDRCVLANGVTLAGHVEVGDFVNFGGFCGIHQFTKIGSYSMLGAGSIVVQDVFPYLIVQGDRAKVAGVNLKGLKINGFSREAIATVKKVYQTIFRGCRTISDAIAVIEADEGEANVKQMALQFLNSSSRGLCR